MVLSDSLSWMCVYFSGYLLNLNLQMIRIEYYTLFSLRWCVSISVDAPLPSLGFIPVVMVTTLQSHRPKYPKMRIISWQDVAESVPYCTLCVFSSLHSFLAFTAVVLLLVESSVWREEPRSKKLLNWTLISVISPTFFIRTSSKLHNSKICNFSSCIKITHSNTLVNI